MVPGLGWSNWPRWVRRLIVVGGSAVVGLWLLGRRAARLEEESGDAALRAARPKRRPGQRYVVIAGRERVGKSAVANALLGTELFGPEAKRGEAAQYRGAWWIRELPAAALSAQNEELWRENLDAADVVVLVVDEQLFRREQMFLDKLARVLPELPRLVVVNKEDLLLRQYTETEAESIRESVREVLARHEIAREDVVWAAAGAPDGGHVEALRARLESICGAV